MVNRLVLLFYSTESAYVTGQIHPFTHTFIQAQKCFPSNIDTLNASGVTQGRVPCVRTLWLSDRSHSNVVFFFNLMWKISAIISKSRKILKLISKFRTLGLQFLSQWPYLKACGCFLLSQLPAASPPTDRRVYWLKIRKNYKFKVVLGHNWLMEIVRLKRIFMFIRQTIKHLELCADSLKTLTVVFWVSFAR